MTGLLLWAWLFSLPGLFLTALGVPGQRRYAGYASLAGPPVILIVALLALIGGGEQSIAIANWIPFLPDTDFAELADPLSALMLVILGFVATAVYFYTLGYMADDAGRRRFFVYLDLFLASMSLLVLAGNLAVLLIGWTGVGISSFLLISFWRDREGTLGAGLQALSANAIGDAALLLAAALQPQGCGTLVTLGQGACAAGPGGASWPEWLALLIFIAAAAKSAQGPLYFWLPNAMAGPTPISALIHAATMVAAGVYLLVRTHALLALAPNVSFSIAVIGVATAIAASAASLFQSNFKKGIAYSTVAQLGYMFAGVGAGAAFTGVFHLFTHASFKGLLFLAAGIVIHGAGGRESLDSLRGLGRFFPASRIGFLIGSLALIGTPLITAGAISKDAIIDAVIAYQPILGWLLLASVILTGLYIGRLFTIVYLAEPVDPQAVHHDPSSERLMNWSLLPLAIGSIVFGYAGTFLQSRLTAPLGQIEPLPSPLDPRGLLAFALGAIGFGLAYWLFVRPRGAAIVEAASSYRAAAWVRVIADAGYAVSGAVSRAHTGVLVNYALGSLIGVAVILLLRVVVGMIGAELFDIVILVLGAIVVLLAAAPISAVPLRATYVGVPFTVVAALVGWLQAPPPLALAIVAPCLVATLALLLLPVLEAEVPAHVAEAAALLLLGTAGAIALATAADLLWAVVGLETLALSAVVLVALGAGDRALEAAFKYFVLGAISLASLLFGVGLVYLGSGSFAFPAAAQVAASPLTLAGVVLVGLGFAFELALFPLHWGALDAYTAAAPSVAGFVMSASKLAAAFILGRLVLTAGVEASQVLIWVGAVTIVWGTFGALAQAANLRRMLAYSAITHAGFIGLAAGSGPEGLSTAGFYAAVYGATAMLVFAALAGAGPDPDLRGLGRLRALALSLGLLSLSGIPPTPGFWAKLAVLVIAWQYAGPLPTLIAVAGGVFSVLYYLRPLPDLLAAIRGDDTTMPKPVVAPGIVLASALVVVIGVFPGVVWMLART